MIRISFAGLLTALVVSAQTAPTAPVTVGIATEAARCEAIASTTICLAYAAPAEPEGTGVFEPGTAALRLTGPDGQAAFVQASVLSPVGRSWLLLRPVGGAEGANSMTGTLPMDLEVVADPLQMAGIGAGRFVAILSVTVGAGPALKVPVQLTVTAQTDSLRAQPDVIPALTVTASPTLVPSRYFINVVRNEVEPAVSVSITPETSDGGTWFTAEMAIGMGQCADQPAPCSFEAVVKAPPRAGEYWGVLVITGDQFGDRVPIQLKVEPARVIEPITIEPRVISISAPHGSKTAMSKVVQLKGGGFDGRNCRVTYTDPWLSVEPPVGTWPLTLRIIMSPFGLEPGVYTDNVIIRAADTNEVLASIPVKFNIIAPTYAPTVLDGGGWRTKLFLVNPTSVEARATLKFWTASSATSAGSPWLVGLENKGLVTVVQNEVIPAGGLRIIETKGAQSRAQQGWVEMTADGPVAMHAVLAESKAVSKWLPVEATVPMQNPYRDHMLLPFDNLENASTSVSLANADEDPISVEVAVLNENGTEITKEGKFTLAGREGGTFVLAQKWTSTATRRGLLSLKFDGGRLFATGLRAREKGFYTFPAVACAEIGVDRALPSVSVGGMWQSTAYLTNATSQSQLGLLRLWPDKTRFAGQELNDVSAPVVPANGLLLWEAPCKDTSRPAAGWLESLYTKQVNGFMLLRQSYTGTPPAGARETYESALGGQRGMLGRVAIPYDTRAGNSTRIVLVNTGDLPTDIQPILYDLAGRFPRFQDSFRLPPKGMLVVDAAEKWELGLPQGILEFSSRQGAALSGVGLRFGEGAMAILPAYEK